MFAGYKVSIYFMLSAPFFIFGVLAFLLWRATKARPPE